MSGSISCDGRAHIRGNWHLWHPHRTEERRRAKKKAFEKPIGGLVVLTTERAIFGAKAKKNADRSIAPAEKIRFNEPSNRHLFACFSFDDVVSV